jgi:hypothetical protein
MKRYEYHEGKKAQEDLKKGMKALFQVPKDAAKEEKSPQEAGYQNQRIRPLKNTASPLGPWTRSP